MGSGFGEAETTPHWVSPVGVCGNQVPSRSPFWWGLCFFAASLQKTQTPRSYAPTLLRSYAPPIHTERIRHARLQTPHA